MTRERELARITSAYIGEVYNGMPGLVVCFDYESGWSQCLSGYLLDAAMVIRFMNAVGVMDLRKAEGKSCWVTHDHGKVYIIEPLHKKDGEAFDIDEWSEWVQARMPGISYHELCTGEDPNARRGKS